MEEPNVQRDPRYALRRVWRYRWPLLAILVGIPALALAISLVLPKTYEATAVVEAQTGGSTASTVSGAAISVSQGALQLVETEPVAKRVAQDLGQSPDSFEDLLEEVSARLSPLQQRTGTQSTQLFEITAEADTAEAAATKANAFAEVVSEVRAERAVERIDDAIETLEQEGSSADTELDREQRASQVQELEALRASQGGSTVIVGPATPPEDPAAPVPERNAAVGFVLAALIVAALIPLLLRFDRRLRETEELEAISGASLLATVPESAFPNRAPRPDAREAFETLRASLTYFNVDRPLRSVVVVSPGRGDGKTTVAVNLAIAAARADQDVVVVDGDLRRPQVAQRLGLGPGPGLEAVLVGSVGVDDALAEVDVGAGRLRVLGAGAGAPNAGVLLGSKRMATLLDELEESADLVVIDTPPILAVSDALPLISKASGIVLVARLNEARRDYVERTCQVVAAAGGKLLGVIATGARSVADHGYYVYGADDAVSVATELSDGSGNGQPARSASGTGRARGLLRRRKGGSG